VSEPLVLSLFPGIGLLDRAFEDEGFCVVRGPDLLWGGDVRTFHPPSGKFDGVIGGPPCVGESKLAHLNGTPGYTLAHEFFRVVSEAQPAWSVMEAVRPHPGVGGHYIALSPRWLGEKQSRRRYFHSNLNLYPHVDVALFEPMEFKHAVLAGHEGKIGTVHRGKAKYPFSEACTLQGLPADFDLPGFTREAAYKAVGNAVPLPMGRAIARAVRRALGLPLVSEEAANAL
jgi:DNA (cytosine-5)-methyltransferase 1